MAGLRALAGLIALAAAAGGLLIWGWASRVPCAQPLGRAEMLARWPATHAGIPARGLVGWWLRLVHPVAQRLARSGIRPAVLTAASVVAGYGSWAVSAAGGGWVALAGGLVVSSAVLDGLDGAVAVASGRATALGGVLDSGADRVAEACFALALWQAGGAAGVVVAAAAAGAFLEYLRARTGAVGLGGLPVVTAGERPTRVVLVAAGLLAGGAWPAVAGGCATAGAAAVLAVSAVGVGQLFRYVLSTRRETISAEQSTSGTPPPGWTDPPTR